MKTLIKLLVKYYIPAILVISLPRILPKVPIYHYYLFPAQFNVVLILSFLFLGFYGISSERLRDFKKYFPIYKPISKLRPSDLGIYTYYEDYIYRPCDQKIEKLLAEKDFAFITGKPNIGKTRAAYQAIRKLKGWHLLIPTYEKIDIQSIKFPFFFPSKKIVLVLDDLQKYSDRSNWDRLLHTLEKKVKEESHGLKIVATCRSGEEFNKVIGRWGMDQLLKQCTNSKCEPERLTREKEESLIRGIEKKIGRKLEGIVTDGTPGSIVLGLNQMKERYKVLEDEPRVILHILKLLRAANIFICTEGLVKNIAKSRIFELKQAMYKWNTWLSMLRDNGFIESSRASIEISHDSYLDDTFIDDLDVTDGTLTELKEELFKLKEANNLFYLGNSFYQRRNFEESMDCYEKALKIKRAFAEANNNLGIVLSELTKYDEAEKKFRKALVINPRFAEAHYNLGTLLEYVGRDREAEVEYKEAVTIKPQKKWLPGFVLYVSIGSLALLFMAIMSTFIVPRHRNHNAMPERPLFDLKRERGDDSVMVKVLTEGRQILVKRLKGWIGSATSEFDRFYPIDDTTIIIPACDCGKTRISYNFDHRSWVPRGSKPVRVRLTVYGVDDKTRRLICVRMKADKQVRKDTFRSGLLYDGSEFELNYGTSKDRAYYFIERGPIKGQLMPKGSYFKLVRIQ